MSATRISRIAASGAVVVLLALTACSSAGDSTGDPAQRQASIDSIMAMLTEDGTLTDVQASCVRTGLDAYTEEELVILDTAERGKEVPEELQDRVIEMLNGCLLDE